MKGKDSGFFWPSFTDLMTSMFFIMLVLFVLSNARLQIKVYDLKRKLRVYELVEQNLKPLKTDTLLFRYEEKYKRFTLGFDVKFALGKYKIQEGDLMNYDVTASKIRNVGQQLQYTIDQLASNKLDNPAFSNVSYLVIISGYASHLLAGSQISDYELSYLRAYNLWDYWKSLGINFENSKYKDLIDLQIAGNGWGGIGRFDRDPENFMINETRNQRFIIQIVPKIGDTK
jgi:hypothetical protein